jgi:hypothetical protein
LKINSEKFKLLRRLTAQSASAIDSMDSKPPLDIDSTIKKRIFNR